MLGLLCVPCVARNTVFDSLSKIGRATNITAVELTASHVMLQWKSPKGKITGYRLLCSCSSNGRTGGNEYEIPADETVLTINNLSPNTKYNITLFTSLKGELSKPAHFRFKTKPLYQSVKVRNPETTIIFPQSTELGPKALFKRLYNHYNPPQNVKILMKDR